jgi:branched-chain amino acid transport system substrate-binding protein
MTSPVARRAVVSAMIKGSLLGLTTAMLLSGAALAQLSGDAVRIGVLTDMNGNLSALSGKGSVVAAQMAADDFGGQVLGKKIEILSADHQNKPDIGSQIANRWFDVDGVDMIVDAPNSAVALAVQGIAKDKNRVFIASAGGTAALTGKACSPTGIHWTWDTYAAAASTGRAIVEDGGKSWFFLTADYAFGHAMEADVARIVNAQGGKVAGGVRHPTNTSDFSSFLLQAQSSSADVIALANGGSDTSNSIKQGRRPSIGIARRKAGPGRSAFSKSTAPCRPCRRPASIRQ